jgi:hypothetical protein
VICWKIEKYWMFFLTLKVAFLLERLKVFKQIHQTRTRNRKLKFNLWADVVIKNHSQVVRDHNWHLNGDSRTQHWLGVWAEWKWIFLRLGVGFRGRFWVGMVRSALEFCINLMENLNKCLQSMFYRRFERHRVQLCFA